MNNIYEESKKIEKQIIKHYGDIAISQGKIIVPIDDYSPADLVVQGVNGYECLEVKSRRSKYNLSFFKKFGISCETSKLKSLNKIYGVHSMELVTVTSDDYVLKGKIDMFTEKKIVNCSKSTAFARNNNQKVDKEFYVVKNFTEENITIWSGTGIKSRIIESYCRTHYRNERY